MTEDEAREARLDALIADMEATIAAARATTAQMNDLFKDMGIEDPDILTEMVRSDRCSPNLRAMIDEDLARLHRELNEAEMAQSTEAGHRRGGKPRRKARRMTRV